MNLIHFQGLNCYFNCVISIAAFWGLNYKDSFAALWSETDFNYDCRHNAYSSKRMLANLEIMGLKLASLSAPFKEAGENLPLCTKEEFIMVGMDAFYLPWSPIYRILHDSHYFFAQKQCPDLFFAFDPTYDKKYLPITPGDIIARAYDIWLVQPTAKQPLPIDVMEEAQSIINTHPQTREKLLGQITECAGEKRKEAAFLAGYVNALINNRYLFQHYLQNSPANARKYHQLFDRDFFLRWEAVKNGLYKASLTVDNNAVIDEASQLFGELIKKELAIAKQIIAIAS